MAKTQEKASPETDPTPPTKCAGCGVFVASGTTYCGDDHCSKDDPTAEQDPAGLQVDDDELDPTRADEPPPPPEFELREVVLRIPIKGFLPSDWVTKHVDIQLSPLEAKGLRYLVEGVLTVKPMLANGHVLARNPDAIRWILQEIARLAEEENKPKGGGS